MDNIEKKFPAPANEHIHVIVKLPASPAGTKRKADEEMADDIREIKKDLKDLVKEESAVNISSVNHEDWKKLTTTRDRAVALLRNELSPNNRANTGEAEQKLSRRKKLVEILGVPTVTHTDYNRLQKKPHVVYQTLLNSIY
ncbi:hypothetical protein RhiirB3_382482 [Rhizophagus irregularis]|nr:hypothetical protein RhiirB3_382482 [Rhizophagus irregularis]